MAVQNQSIPLAQTSDRNVNQLQSNIIKLLNNLVRNRIVNCAFLDSIKVDGQTSINHGLGRKPQGWIIADIDSSATVYRSAPFDKDKLTLTSSAPATISLVVY